MLRLVYANPNLLPAESASWDTTNSNKAQTSSPSILCHETILASILPHFTTEVVCKDFSSYTMVARDLSHYLSCELSLEVRTSHDESEFGDVVCHFPVIQEKYLEALLWEDEPLLDMIMIQFQLKLLEQLIRFCANHNALKLVIHIDPFEALHLKAYKKFVAHEEQVLTHQGRKTALVIPTDIVTYDKLIDYMSQISADFQEMLQADQRHNPVIRQYLKFCSFA